MPNTMEDWLEVNPIQAAVIEATKDDTLSPMLNESTQLFPFFIWKFSSCLASPFECILK